MKSEQIKKILLAISILIFISCNNADINNKLAETQKSEAEAIKGLRQRNIEMADILRRMNEISGKTSIAYSNIEKGRKTNSEEIVALIDILKERLEEAEKQWGEDAVLSELQKQFNKLKKDIADLKKKNAVLEKENEKLKGENTQKGAKIEEQQKTIEELYDELESSQMMTWYVVGKKLLQVYDEYKDVTTGGIFGRNKDKKNEKRMKENKRQLLLQAKECFQEAHKLKHKDALTQINLIDKELSKL